MTWHFYAFMCAWLAVQLLAMWVDARRRDLWLASWKEENNRMLGVLRELLEDADE